MSGKTHTIIAGLFGNTLEWYDFILYANFASIFATLFFPAHNQFTSLLLTFGVFASGFLIRPLGAVVFGYIGDHFGRRIALLLSIAVITVPTGLVGFLPSYASVGIAAPILLTVLRLCQGLAVSGELTSASTFLIEHANTNRRGLMGCLVMSTAFLGILIGAVVASLITFLLTAEQVLAWGWRVPFWMGSALGVVGIFIRLRSKESPLFLKAEQHQRSPLRKVLLEHPKKMLLAFVLTIVMAVGNYIFIAFIITFLAKYIGLPLRDAELINLIGMAVIVVLFPVMGILSDKIGRKPVFMSGLFGMILFAAPIFWLLSQKQFAYALAGELLFCVVLVPISALIPTMLAEIFPTAVRNSGTGLSYNIALAIFGGTAPVVALTLIQVSGSNFAPAYYLIISALISLVALYFVKEGYHKPLP